MTSGGTRIRCAAPNKSRRARHPVRSPGRPSYLESRSTNPNHFLESHVTLAIRSFLPGGTIPKCSLVLGIQPFASAATGGNLSPDHAQREVPLVRHRHSWPCTPGRRGVPVRGGTAVNRPAEYGPHWMGFAHRFGINMVGSAAANAVEASAGLLLQEDPRYFRASQLPFKARVENMVRLTFLARGANRSFEPAYTRYAGIVGSNFLSNAWRVHSVANVQSALLRSSEEFAGRMATNAFAELGPDVKHIFHRRNRATPPSPKKAD